MRTVRITKRRASTAIAALVLVLVGCATVFAQTDPLPSWNDGAAKQAIVTFVKDTTTQGSPSFLPQAERISTFDQDGTLWGNFSNNFNHRFAGGGFGGFPRGGGFRRYSNAPIRLTI